MQSAAAREEGVFASIMVSFPHHMLRDFAFKVTLRMTQFLTNRWKDFSKGSKRGGRDHKPGGFLWQDFGRIWFLSVYRILPQLLSISNITNQRLKKKRKEGHGEFTDWPCFPHGVRKAWGCRPWAALHRRLPEPTGSLLWGRKKKDMKGVKMHIRKRSEEGIESH